MNTLFKVAIYLVAFFFVFSCSAPQKSGNSDSSNSCNETRETSEYNEGDKLESNSDDSINLTIIGLLILNVCCSLWLCKKIDNKNVMESIGRISSDLNSQANRLENNINTINEKLEKILKGIESQQSPRITNEKSTTNGSKSQSKGQSKEQTFYVVHDNGGSFIERDSQESLYQIISNNGKEGTFECTNAPKGIEKLIKNIDSELSPVCEIISRDEDPKKIENVHPGECVLENGKWKMKKKAKINLKK